MAEHTRDHRSFLAAAEKRALIAIAQRLPAAVNSDHLTSLGLVAMALAGAGFALTSGFTLALQWVSPFYDTRSDAVPKWRESGVAKLRVALQYNIDLHTRP